MQIVSSFEGMILGCSKKPWNYEGKSGVTFKLSIEFDGEVDNVKCTEQVYDRVRSGEAPRFAECGFNMVCDSRYGKVCIDDFQVLSTK